MHTQQASKHMWFKKCVIIILSARPFEVSLVPRMQPIGNRDNDNTKLFAAHVLKLKFVRRPQRTLCWGIFLVLEDAQASSQPHVRQTPPQREHCRFAPGREYSLCGRTERKESSR